MARLTGVGHALISGMSVGWMGRGSGGTSIVASGAKAMKLCQRTVWHGMGPVRYVLANGFESGDGNCRGKRLARRIFYRIR